MAKNIGWVIGFHAVTTVLRLSPDRALRLLVADNRSKESQQQIIQLANDFNIPVINVDKKSLSKQCGVEQNQGVALETKPKKELKEAQLMTFVESLEKPFLLILDQVQDPHNFGACLRTADAAGVDAVIVAKDNAAPITPVVQKVASGAAETVAIYRVTNLARTMENLKQLGVWMIGTSDQADHAIYENNLNSSIGLVMGAEGKGLRKLTQAKCDALVSLPMAGKVVNSLNVSVATGVCLYEIVRQRS